MDKDIDDKERVARILSQDWFEGGNLLHIAFALNYGETYLSVNRLASPSYYSDVQSFVAKHKEYAFGDQQGEYRRAVLNVGDVRSISITHVGKVLAVNVEVEPRDSHTKSHAGIFTRYKQKNLKKGESLFIEHSEEIACDVILLKLQRFLLRLSTLETGELENSGKE